MTEQPRPRRTPERVATKVPPCFRADYEIADVSALQALVRGEATADQQKRALDWVLYEAAQIRNVSFQPDSDRATSFAEGRRFVGLQIARLLSLSLRDLTLAAQRNKQG